MRTLLPTFGVLAVLLCTVAPNVTACSTVRPRPTDAQLFEEAREVFVARITATSLRQFPTRDCGDDEEECAYVKGEYELVESLKGKSKRRGHVKDVVFGPGNCSLGLMPGWYYVFYVNEPHRMVLHPGGSFPIGPYPSGEELEELRSIRKPPHVRPRDEG